MYKFLAGAQLDCFNHSLQPGPAGGSPAVKRSKAAAHWQFDYCEGSKRVGVRALAYDSGRGFFRHVAKNLNPAAAGS